MLEIILEAIKSSVKDSVISSINTDNKILHHLKQNPTSAIIKCNLKMHQYTVQKYATFLW